MESDDERLMSEDDDDNDWAAVWNDNIINTASSSNSNLPINLASKIKVPNRNLYQEATTSKMSAPLNETTQSETKVLTSLDLNDNKAGMANLDREKINKIIMEASKGSRFYENEQRKQKQTLARIEDQKRKIAAISPRELADGIDQADKLLSDLDRGRNLSRTIVHVDMDAFYAAVEMRDRPDLKNKPMAVGGTFMLSTSNYVARRYGVRAGMPGFIGKKLCPHLVILPLNFDKYTEVSDQVRTVFAQYDHNFCPMSLDEAYLDITEHLKTRANLDASMRTFMVANDDTFCQCVVTEVSEKNSGKESDQISGEICLKCVRSYYDKEDPPSRVFGITAWEAVNEMRFRIYTTTLLTASAGIAPNMMLAKVCSDENKPDGQYEIAPDRDVILKFVSDLPIRKIGGIGKVSESLLSALDIRTCSDLYHQRAVLNQLYSNISFSYFMRICLGVGATKVESDSERKSMSVERTFPTMSSIGEMMSKCRELCEALIQDLKAQTIQGKTVTIKLKTVDFEVKTRAQTLNNYTMDLDSILPAAQSLLRAEIANSNGQLKLRLMGVRLSNFPPPSSSPSKRGSQITLTRLFQNQPEISQKAEKRNSLDEAHNVDSACTGPITADKEELETVKGKSKLNDLVETDDDIYSAETDVENESENEMKKNVYKAPKLCYNNNSSCLKEASQSACSKVSTTTNAGGNGINMEFQCPICDKKIDSINLTQFNRHIDSCLSEESGESREAMAASYRDLSTNVVPVISGGKTCKSTSKTRGKLPRNASRTTTTTRMKKQVSLGDSFSFSYGRYRHDDDVVTMSRGENRDTSGSTLCENTIDWKTSQNGDLRSGSWLKLIPRSKRNETSHTDTFDLLINGQKDFVENISSVSGNNCSRILNEAEELLTINISDEQENLTCQIIADPNSDTITNRHSDHVSNRNDDAVINRKFDLVSNRTSDPISIPNWEQVSNLHSDSVTNRNNSTVTNRNNSSVTNRNTNRNNNSVTNWNNSTVTKRNNSTVTNRNNNTVTNLNTDTVIPSSTCEPVVNSPISDLVTNQTSRTTIRNLTNHSLMSGTSKTVGSLSSDIPDNHITSDSQVADNTNEENLICPICGKKLLINDLELFNRHIDNCLVRPSQNGSQSQKFGSQSQKSGSQSQKSGSKRKSVQRGRTRKKPKQ